MSISLVKQVSSHTALEKVVWSKPHTLKHKVVAFQTTRLSPEPSSVLSVQPFDYFNLGLHVEDNAVTVEQNRKSLRAFLPEHTSIQWLNQVHGNTVVEITNTSAIPITADAVITREKHKALAIMTADCLPILLSDDKGEVIAAIHGGWRPLASGIIANTLDKMQVRPSQVSAWLGPCIGPEKFEVGKEVKDVFCQHNLDLNEAFLNIDTSSSNLSNTSGKYLANLQMIASLQLKSLGVQQIQSLQECTFSLESKYYSFRRTPKTGRMASVICLKSI